MTKKHGFGRMTEKQALKVLRGLRTAADRGEREFIAALVEVETETDFWKAGDATFANYLSRTHLADPKRYERGKLALGTVAEIDSIGFAAAAELVRIDDGDDRLKATADMVALAAQSGMPVSERTAETIVKPFLPPKMRIATRQQMELLALRKETKRLQARVAELEAELAEYRERVGETAPERNEKGSRRRTARKVASKGARA